MNPGIIAEQQSQYYGGRISALGGVGCSAAGGGHTPVQEPEIVRQFERAESVLIELSGRQTRKW